MFIIFAEKLQASKRKKRYSPLDVGTGGKVSLELSEIDGHGVGR